ncbi:MAG: outer membrane beta-barrel protein [Candidatus Thiodiazotropha sp. (ex Dulcina madagascariensis)]|nr:outer membrane beta-barrel protein [Candidatus Thiodiazotropha sp. (ex Dulcina madagascariensis)]
MIRIILTIVLMTSATALNAADRQPYLGISMTAIYADFARLEGDLDSGPDQSSLSRGGSTSGRDFDVDSSYRWGLRVFRGAYLTDQGNSPGNGTVFSELGVFVLPGYKVEGDGKAVDSRIEMRVDVIGIDANIGYEIGRFHVKGGLHAEWGRGRVHYWEVNASCENNLCEDRYTVTDFSTGATLGLGYRLGKMTYLTLERQFDYFDKNTLGNSDVTKFGLELWFK